MEGGEQEDYMGDLSLYLPPEDPTSSKKKLGSKAKEPPSVSKPKRPKILSWQEQRKLEIWRKQREEDEHTKARLEAAIPESNLGFRMLRQMGYKPGTALGKEGCGMTEPVGLEIRRSRAGIGRETPAEAEARKETEVAEKQRRREKEMMSEFGLRQKTQWREKRVARDYRKAEAVLSHLENTDTVEDKQGGDEEEKREDEEEERVITEEDLHGILMKLREQHWYCLYCGYQYESEATLQTACPGPYEEDH